jgi:hypothetical protein
MLIHWICRASRASTVWKFTSHRGKQHSFKVSMSQWAHVLDLTVRLAESQWALTVILAQATLWSFTESQCHRDATVILLNSLSLQTYT